LRLDTKRQLRPEMVNNINAKSYKDPTKNGLNCFEKVNFTKNSSLRSGDIIASSYHIAIVDNATSDPFGISKVKNVDGCDNISMKNMRFNLLQSAPDNGALGIGRWKASEYIPNNFFFSMGFSGFPAAACRARFSGSSVSAGNWFVQVVRHKGTPECMGLPLKFARQECVDSCL